MERDTPLRDNRAVNVPCDAPTHTFVEKLQTISTKYRRLDASRAFPANFLRHYYDVYCLLGMEEVQGFIGTPAYQQRKIERFRSGDELAISLNPAFVLADAAQCGLPEQVVLRFAYQRRDRRFRLRPSQSAH